MKLPDSNNNKEVDEYKVVFIRLTIIVIIGVMLNTALYLNWS